MSAHFLEPTDADFMLIQCKECLGSAIITSRKQQSPDVADLYCVCKNAECGHTFVYSLSFSHTLSPSRNHGKKLMLDLFQSMDGHERDEWLTEAKGLQVS